MNKQYKYIIQLFTKTFYIQYFTYLMCCTEPSFWRVRRWTRACARASLAPPTARPSTAVLAPSPLPPPPLRRRHPTSSRWPRRTWRSWRSGRKRRRKGDQRLNVGIGKLMGNFVSFDQMTGNGLDIMTWWQDRKNLRAYSWIWTGTQPFRFEEAISYFDKLQLGNMSTRARIGSQYHQQMGHAKWL